MAVADISVASSEPQHRIGFLILVFLTALEGAVFIGFEVSGAINDRSRFKGLAECLNALRQLVHKLGTFSSSDELSRVRSNLSDDELGSEQSHSIHPLPGHFMGATWIGQVNVEIGGGFNGRVKWCDLFFKSDFVQDVPSVDFAMSAVNRPQLAVSEHRGGLSRADHAGYSQFSTDNGSVGSPPARVGDNAFGPFHSRHIIRIGHLGD